MDTNRRQFLLLGGAALVGTILPNDVTTNTHFQGGMCGWSQDTPDALLSPPPLVGRNYFSFTVDGSNTKTIKMLQDSLYDGSICQVKLEGEGWASLFRGRCISIEDYRCDDRGRMVVAEMAIDFVEVETAKAVTLPEKLDGFAD